MKILWLVEPMGGREGGEVKVARLSHTGGDLWNTNQPANTFAHAGAKLPWDGEALRVSSLRRHPVGPRSLHRGGDKNSYACVCVASCL